MEMTLFIMNNLVELGILMWGAFMMTWGLRKKNIHHIVFGGFLLLFTK